MPIILTTKDTGTFLNVVLVNNIQVAKHNIIFGLHIPNYPTTKQNV